MTNRQATTHESWLVRCSPRAPGFSRSNQHERDLHPRSSVFTPFSITPGTQGLTCLLGRQEKHVRLIIRQLPIKAGCVNTPLTIQDLAKAVFLDIARNMDTFSAGPTYKTFCLMQPPTHPPTVNSSTPRKITKLGFLSLRPLVFNRRFTISELKEQIHIIAPAKGTLTAGLVF